MLPDEANELYRRNSIAVEYPKEIMQGPSVMEFASKIEKGIESTFDLIISNTGVKSTSKFVTAFSPDSVPEDIVSGKITDGSEDKISAYVNANSRHIIRIDVPEKTNARINAMVINSAHMPFQVLVNCGRDSKLSLFEYYCSADADKSYAAPLHEFVAKENSAIEFTLINNKKTGSGIVGFSKSRSAAGSSINANFVYSGSSITKMKGYFDACVENSRIDVKEIVLGTADQKFDINTFVMNSKPNTQAKLESGAVLDGNSLCMLKGYAKVEKMAKNAKSRVEEHGILLSETAHIDALPDMAIDYSDGVSATHSAATAPIDNDALFYIMSRGIDRPDGRKLFVGAFMSKYLSSITNPLARELATSLLLDKAESGRFGELPKISMKDVWASNK